MDNGFVTAKTQDMHIVCHTMQRPQQKEFSFSVYQNKGSNVTKMRVMENRDMPNILVKM